MGPPEPCLRVMRPLVVRPYTAGCASLGQSHGFLCKGSLPSEGVLLLSWTSSSVSTHIRSRVSFGSRKARLSIGHRFIRSLVLCVYKGLWKHRRPREGFLEERGCLGETQICGCWTGLTSGEHSMSLALS